MRSATHLSRALLVAAVVTIGVVPHTVLSVTGAAAEALIGGGR